MERIISYYNAPIPTISYYVHNQLSEKIKSLGYSVVISVLVLMKFLVVIMTIICFGYMEMRNQKILII